MVPERNTASGIVCLCVYLFYRKTLNQRSPHVGFLEDVAVRGGRLPGVQDFEAGGAQLEGDRGALHLLRQRPQGAVAGRPRLPLDLPVGDLAEQVVVLGVAVAQRREQQEKRRVPQRGQHDGRGLVTRLTGSGFILKASRGGGTSCAETDGWETQSRWGFVFNRFAGVLGDDV